jgi:hypothetical protein
MTKDLYKEFEREAEAQPAGSYQQRVADDVAALLDGNDYMGDAESAALVNFALGVIHEARQSTGEEALMTKPTTFDKLVDAIPELLYDEFGLEDVTKLQAADVDTAWEMVHIICQTIVQRLCEEYKLEVKSA